MKFSELFDGLVMLVGSIYIAYMVVYEDIFGAIKFENGPALFVLLVCATTLSWSGKALKEAFSSNNKGDEKHG
jgi:hypothetical protein